MTLRLLDRFASFTFFPTKYDYCRKKQKISLRQGSLLPDDAMHVPFSAFRSNSCVRSPWKAPARRENAKQNQTPLSEATSSRTFHHLRLTHPQTLQFFNSTIKPKQISQYGQSWYVVHINHACQTPGPHSVAAHSQMAGSLETI
jgi:hypothetical protein